MHRSSIDEIIERVFNKEFDKLLTKPASKEKTILGKTRKNGAGWCDYCNELYYGAKKWHIRKCPHYIYKKDYENLFYGGILISK